MLGDGAARGATPALPPSALAKSTDPPYLSIYLSIHPSLPPLLSSSSLSLAFHTCPTLPSHVHLYPFSLCLSPRRAVTGSSDGSIPVLFYFSFVFSSLLFSPPPFRHSARGARSRMGATLDLLRRDVRCSRGGELISSGRRDVEGCHVTMFGCAIA